MTYYLIILILNYHFLFACFKTFHFFCKEERHIVMYIDSIMLHSKSYYI